MPSADQLGRQTSSFAKHATALGVFLSRLKNDTLWAIVGICFAPLITYAGFAAFGVASLGLLFAPLGALAGGALALIACRYGRSEPPPDPIDEMIEQITAYHEINRALPPAKEVKRELDRMLVDLFRAKANRVLKKDKADEATRPVHKLLEGAVTETSQDADFSTSTGIVVPTRAKADPNDD